MQQKTSCPLCPVLVAMIDTASPPSNLSDQHYIQSMLLLTSVHHNCETFLPLTSRSDAARYVWNFWTELWQKFKNPTRRTSFCNWSARLPQFVTSTVCLSESGAVLAVLKSYISLCLHSRSIRLIHSCIELQLYVAIGNLFIFFDTILDILTVGHLVDTDNICSPFIQPDETLAKNTFPFR